jgi:hypothetical protein
MTPQDNPGYVLVSREQMALICSRGWPTEFRHALHVAPPGYSLDTVKAAVNFGLKYFDEYHDFTGWETEFDRWLTEHLKGGSTS